jgi:hypothetical protein
VRFFPGKSPEDVRRDEIPRVVVLAVYAFWLDWRLGLFIILAYSALGIGVWRESSDPKNYRPLTWPISRPLEA